MCRLICSLLLTSKILYPSWVISSLVCRFIPTVNGSLCCWTGVLSLHFGLARFLYPFQIRDSLLKEMSLSDHHYTSGSHLKLHSHYLADLCLQLSEEYLESFFLCFLAAKYKQSYFTDPKPMTCFMRLPQRKHSPIGTITGLYRL